MFRWKTAALAAATTLALASGALAQDAMEMHDRTAFVFRNSVKSHPLVLQLSDAQHAMVMKYAKPLKAGTMVFMSGGQLYLLQDRRMAKGKMMFDGL
jgi:hypothetical protein